jgi:hypothetical protein
MGNLSENQRVVYAVTSSGRDLFSAMTRVSIASLRISNPFVKVAVACDDVSAAALKRSCDPLLNEVDDFIICDTPEGDAGYRNRHVKTRLRQLIEGPFLFLDSDTLVRGDLSTIFSLNTDFAAAPNHSSDDFREQAFDPITKKLMTSNSETLRSLRWQVGDRVYVNGGVLFFNDTPNSYRISDAWHRKWLQSVEKFGVHQDQLALNAAVFESRPRVEVLPHKFNTQVKSAPQVARDAIIWHYYASHTTSIVQHNGKRVSTSVALTSFDGLVERVLQGEKLPLDSVVEIIQHPHPWRRNSWLDDLMARGIARNGHLDHPAYNEWFQGHRASACYYWTLHPLKRVLAILRWRVKLRTRLREALARIAPQHR